MENVQLIKKRRQGGYKDIFPRTFLNAIRDKESGVTLTEILQGFNMYFLSHTGSRESTRLQIPSFLRREGLWITYVLYDHTVITEWYNSEKIDDESWKSDSNWRVGSNALVGDISISSDGYWVINGVVTEAIARGEQGITPLLRIGDNNKLQVSYNEGKQWNDISDFIVPKFRWLQGEGTTAGTVQISMDLGKTWSNLSNPISNNLRIKKYIGINESLPTSGVEEGTIYMKGPYYAEDDALNDNPIYRMWIYAWKGNTLAWQDNGEFTSITAGVVQETGDSETEVMSQKAVSEKFSELGQYIDNEEFVRIYIDNEGKFLFGIRKDGSIEWSNGVPLPVQRYVDNLIRIVNKEIEEKVGEFETSQEFIRILTDADGNILEALRKDGVKYFYALIDTLPLTDRCMKSLSKNLGLDSYLSAVTNARNNNIVLFDEYGKIKDSGYTLKDLPNGLPTGGSNGEVLRTDGKGGYYWSTVPTTTITDVSQTFGVLVDQYENLNNGVSWAKAIQKAVDVAGEGGTIIFTPNKTYPIDQTINVKSNQVFIGNNATIFRMNESKASVASDVVGNGVNNTIQFDSVPEDWKSENADWSSARVYLFSESEGKLGRFLGSFKFRAINGDVVICRNIQGVGDEVDVFNYSIPKGTIAVRSYNLFSGGQTNPAPYKVYNLNFNGNKANNSSLIYWGINNTIHIYSRGSVVDSCRFIDIPTENIVTQGSIIQNCYAKNLNGSFIHLSCPPRNILADGVEDYMGTFVTNNFCENIMIYDESILGHNTAPVTYSWNPGKLVVIGNQFYGNNTSKCILMDASTPDEPTNDTEGGDMRYAVYLGNIYVNFPKIGDIPLVSDNTTKISTRLISNNIFRNCGSSDMKRLYQTELKFEDNLYDGNTKVDTNGNSKMYRIDRELNTIPSSAVLTDKYSNLPNNGLVYVPSIDKLYRKIQTSDTTTKWINESVTYLN